jgi:hypothetical protein
MESMLDGRAAQAAILYLRITAEAAIPALFRVEALVRGLKLLSPENMNVEEITSLVRSILTTVDSYRTALDIARSMLRGGNVLIPLKLEAAAVGRRLADKAIDAAATPREQLLIVEYLARKQYWDLSDTGSILARWDTLSAVRKAEFGALGGSSWYEYLVLVFKALVSEGRVEEASQIAAQVIDQDKGTVEGYAIVGSEYASWLLQNQEVGKALDCFAWIAKESPTHRKAASSHYWIALRLLNEGDTAKAKACCIFIRRCFAGAPSLLSEWKLDAKAICILSDLSVEGSVELARGAFDANFLNQTINEISLLSC